MISSIVTSLQKMADKLKSKEADGNLPKREVDAIKPDLHTELERAYPKEYLAAWSATDCVVNAVEGIDLTALSRHSPALRGFDWSTYLRLSTLRMVRSQHALRRHGANSGRLADIGSYFGNFSLMFANNGYEVTAVDSYSQYGCALSPISHLLTNAGVKVRDFRDMGESLDALPSESFDIVLSMGVIEHIPHTPRLLLEAMNRILRPGGLLVIDTPNLGYLYTREKLARGETIFCPLELQYDTELPFEGHHREYTPQELRWMLNRIGHELLDLQMFSFSMYALSQISGDDLTKFNAMESDPSLRELMLTVSRKK